MKQPLSGQAPVVARINVVPIIDVALVLVIILLITAPMITALNMEIDLPQARTRSVKDEIRISVTLGCKGELYVDDEMVTMNSLVPVLDRKIEDSSNENILIIVRADATTQYESVKRVINDARSAGAKRIAVATRQRGNGKR